MNDFKCNSPYSNETTSRNLNVECVNERSKLLVKSPLVSIF